jgi:hypothetical protein
MATKAPAKETEDALEVLEPDVTEREVDLGEGYVYTQKPLSFFGKIELFSVTGKAVDKALSDGASIGDILGDVPDINNPLSTSTSEADVFISAVVKIAEHAPELLKDLYCVILAVPRGERERAKELFENLSDDEGIKILEVFVDQNWEVLTNFFKEKILPLSNKIGAKVRGSGQ